MVRVCKNCGVAGHNVRTCTQPMKPQAPPSPPKKRGRPKGSKNNPKTVTTTVVTDPQVVAQTPSSPPITSNTKIKHGFDVSGMKEKEVRGQVQYETKKGTFILFPEINITREETFMNVVRRIEEVVKQRNSSEGMKLVFKVKELNREEKKLPLQLVSYAKKNVVPGSFPKKVNGVTEWYWETITYMVEHSEFEDSKFEYIGQIAMAGGDNSGSGDWNFVSKYYDRTDSESPSALGGSQAWQEYEPISAELDQKIRPQIDEWMDVFQEHSLQQANKKFPHGQEQEAISRGLTGVKKIYGGGCYCYKCNPKGDEVWRGSANLYLATQDIKNYRIGRLGKKETSVSYIDIPKGTLIPLGGGCEYSVNPIDIELVTSLYGDSRIRSSKQSQWQNPYGMYGWGFKQMDMRAFLTRVFAYYNKKFDTTMKMLRAKNKLTFLIPDSMVLEGGITYKSLNPYQLDKYIEQGTHHSYTVRQNYNKLLDTVSDKVFPRTGSQQKAGSKGIFDNKSSFLLEARYYEHDGTHWLQPASSKDGGIEEFLEAYDLQKDDEDFFIEVIQPMYNDDGVLLVDEDGEIVEDFVKLPNPDKLTELYALSGGINEVYSPDEVKEDIENAIDFLENLDVSAMPPILDKYFKSQQILNPRKQLTQIDGVGKKKNSHKDAASIWKIYKLSILEDMRKEAYEAYLQTELENRERRVGMQLTFEFLDETQEAIYGNLPDLWTMRQDYITDEMSEDDLDTIKEVRRMTDHLYKLDGTTHWGIYYTTPVNWELIKDITEKVNHLEALNEKEQERIEELGRKARIITNKIMQAYRDAGGYISWRASNNQQSNIPSMGETYTNEEIFNLLGISINYTNKEIVEINEEIDFNACNFNSSGLITSMMLYYSQMNLLKNYFNKKQMANLGMGQAPTVPTVSTPTTTTVTSSYDKHIDHSGREQLERNIKKTKFPEAFGEGVKGYIYSVSPKTYNRPFNKNTKYVGVITANNDDSNLDGHFINFPYEESELPVKSPEGMAVIMDFKTLKLDTGWYRTQTTASKVSMRQD
jgi:hypothetical protein